MNVQTLNQTSADKGRIANAAGQEVEPSSECCAAGLAMIDGGQAW